MELTDKVRDGLRQRRYVELPALLNANFDRRAALCQISTGNLRMVDAARSTGASAKFTGSGGAIVGTYRDEAMFHALQTKLEPMGIHVIRPEIAPSVGGGEP
jgi:glucuronokinase